jgi:hypothetical protein
VRPEIAILSEVVNASGKVAFVGCSGSGKTSTIRELLIARRGIPQRVIAFDPYREFNAAMVKTRAQASAILRGPYGRVAITDPALFSELILVALEAENCLLVADEAQRLLPSDGRWTEASEALTLAATGGRHSRCSLLWASQSPGRVSYDLIDNTQARIVGNLSAEASLNKISDWSLDRKEVASLQPHSLILSRPGLPAIRFRSVKM